jgi:hypothetical protein
VFLGCLQDEAHPDFEDLCLKCAAVELGVPKRDKVVDSLRKDDHWPAIKEIMESFRTLRCPFPIRTIFELKPSTIPSKVIIMKRMIKQELVRINLRKKYLS